MFFCEILVMSVKQKVVCVQDDSHPLACNKSQKKIDSRTVDNSVSNDSVSLNCARMQIRAVGSGSKEVAQKRCAIRWKPTACGKREGSLSSLDCRDFEKRIKEVNIVGLENKVLLVKVTKNGNEPGSTLGKHLPKSWKRQCSLGPFQHNLDKLTSGTARKDKSINVLKLEKRESPVCCASVVVEDNNTIEPGHDGTGHKLGNIHKKASSVSPEIFKDSFQNISKCSSKNASSYPTSSSDTVTEIECMSACKIVKSTGNGDGGSKSKNAIAFLLSKGSVMPGNVGHDGADKMAPVPPQKIFKLSQQQLESASTHVELVQRTVNETYKVKCLKNGRCSIKKMEERPKPFKCSGKDGVSEVITIDSNVRNDLHVCDDGQVYHRQNTEASVCGKGSGVFQDCSQSLDINEVQVGSLLSNLCHYENKDDPIPSFANAEGVLDPAEREKYKFQTPVNNVTKRRVQQNQYRFTTAPSDGFRVSFSSQSCSMPDVKDLQSKSIEKLPDSTEWVFSRCDQFEPARQKTAVLIREGLAPRSVPDPTQAASLHQCNFTDKNYVRDFDSDVQHIPEPVQENVNSVLAEGNLLQVVGTSEGYCSSYDSRTVRKDGSVPSPCVSSNICCKTTGLKVSGQDLKDEENPMIRDSRILSPKEPCDGISVSHVVWTLQTPKASVAPLYKPFSENRKRDGNNFPPIGKEKTNCNLLDIGSSESYPSSVYNEMAKKTGNETKDVVDMIETISEAIDADCSDTGNLVAQGCRDDEFNVPASLIELKEEVALSKESTETLCQKNPFEMEGNKDDPYTSEMLAITLPLLGSNSNRNSREADIYPVGDISDIASALGDIPCLPDISSMLTYAGFGYEVTDNAHSHQPTEQNQQAVSPQVNATVSNEIWNSLEEVPVDHSMSGQPCNLDVNNPKDFNKLLDSILLEVDQGFLDPVNHKDVSYTENEENHISSNNTLNNSMLTGINVTGDGSLTQAVLENDPKEVARTHSVGCAKKKGTSSKRVQSLPVTVSNSTRKEFSHTKIEGCGSVARTVSFKTRPAIRPIKCVVRGQVVENELQKQPRPLRFVLGKDRRLQNQDGSTSWPQREEFNPERFTISRGRNTLGLQNGEQMEDNTLRNPTGTSNSNVIPVCVGNVATTVSQMKVPGGVFEASKFVLPVGKTGLSITIPTNAPTNITSFFLPPNPASCAPPTTGPAQNARHCSSANQAVNVTTSVKFKSPALYADLPQQRAHELPSEDARKILIPSTVITVGDKAEAVYQVPIPQSLPAESLYMMVPSSTSAHSNPVSVAPSLLSNIVPPPTSEQLSSSTAVMSDLVSHCTRQQLVTKSCQKSYVHPVPLKSPQLKPATVTTSLPAKIPLVLNAETSEPIKILINTKSNIVDTPSSTCSRERASIEGMTSVEFGKKSEFVPYLQQKILKKKPCHDFIQKKFNRLLTDELRVHFPDIPESILKVLSLPPQAVRRGYFSMRDLRTLRTEALALQLDIIYKEHVCVCTTHNCSTCFDFLQQQDALSQAEREQKVSCNSRAKSRTSNGRGRSKGRGRRRKTQRASYAENRSDSSGRPLHCFLSTSKRKVDDAYCIGQLGGTLKAARTDDLTGNSVKFSGMLVAGDENTALDRDFSKVLKMKRSYSDSDIHMHTEMIPQRNVRPPSCDDSYLVIYHTIKDSSLQSMKWSNNPEVGKECSENKGILTKDQLKNRPKKRWESHQHANMMMAAVNDLHLKKQLEKDFVPFTEEGTQQKKQSYGSFAKPLHFDLHSLEIGPLNLAKFEQHIQPRLHVIYTARKFVYELEIRQNGEEGEIQKPAVLESKNDSPSHLFLTIDVPFSTLQAINITSNLVLLVMNTVPVVQVVAKRGISCIPLSWGDVLPSGQRNYISHLKAALAIYPVHKVLLCNKGRALSLHDGLCGFSDWFTQMMSNPIPLRDDQIPSWSLESHAEAGMIISETSRTSLPGGGDSLSSAQNHSVLLRKTNQKTWQEQAKYSAVMEGSNSSTNSASGPSSAALYLISAVKAALESKELLHPVPFSPVQFPLAPYLEKGCSCEGACHIMDCPCARAGALCHTRQTCLCKECDNPLNILHVLGLDVHTARVDECLMQNLYSYNMAGLCSLLVSQVILPCCGAAPELLHIIPGTVVCNSCGMTVCYSWCSHHIHLQDLCPRNHCLICCSCKPALHTHCQKCQQCTPSTNQGLCANCGTHKLF